MYSILMYALVQLYSPRHKLLTHSHFHRTHTHTYTHTHSASKTHTQFLVLSLKRRKSSLLWETTTLAEKVVITCLKQLTGTMNTHTHTHISYRSCNYVTPVAMPTICVCVPIGDMKKPLVTLTLCSTSLMKSGSLR